MPERLYKEFIEELQSRNDLTDLLLCYGVHGILEEYESWLVEEGHLRK